MQEGIHNCSIINDAYSNDLDSLRIALDFQADQKHHVKNTLFISDIEENGLDKITKAREEARAALLATMPR